MTKYIELQKKAVEDMLHLLPDEVMAFTGSDYKLPIKTTFLGEDDIDPRNIKQQLVESMEKDVKDVLEPIILAAELYEAACPDKNQYFIQDGTVQQNVFMGSKWKAGWVLLLGDDKGDGLVDELKKLGFMVFIDKPGIPDTTFIGDRPTSPIYFLQMMVRYGLVWGNILPGDDHEMGHYLEKDMPGMMIIQNDLESLKYVIALGLMKLGAPAVVPSTFPFPYGNRIVADGMKDIITKGIHFQNLRLRYYKDEIIALPEFCNPAYANEKIEVAQSFCGSHSFFTVLHSDKTVLSSVAEGETSGEIGIVVEINHPDLTMDMEQIIEQTALRTINFIHGVKAIDNEAAFRLNLAEEVSLDTGKITEAIQKGIRVNYPRLENIGVRIIFDLKTLSEEVENIRKHKETRKEYIKNMSEENTEEFCVCTECRPFSLVHTCIVTPDRIPMCASRTYQTIKAGACFGSSTVPYQRKSEKQIPLRHMFKKGRVIDPLRGEYEGSNLVYSEMTEGKLNRVFFHSVREYPHTSCGCFQNLAFWIEEVKGLGIMSRGSKAITPNGLTWEMLANLAGGKQSSGIMGVSNAHIKSRHFLKGDGGIANVVWVDSELFKKINSCFLPEQKVATEIEVTNMNELQQYLQRQIKWHSMTQLE